MSSKNNKVHRKLLHIAGRLIQRPRIMVYQLLSGAQIQGKPILNQPLQSVGLGVIEFLGKVHIGVFPSPHFFSTYSYIEARNKNSKVTIGDGSWINNGFCAIAEHTSIEIGSRVLIGTNVEIIDSDFHGLQVRERLMSKPEWSRKVQIKDDVFIGSNVKITKGVTIGIGAVVANGSVVAKDVPAYTVVGGNPARVIKTLEQCN
ncbi:MAG: acyltransferase [Chlorobiaceae bacterium]